VKKLPPAASAGKGKPPPSAAPGQLDAFKYKYSSEDADGLVVDLIPSNIQTDFADPNWKIRLAALEEMTTWVEGEVESLESELVVRFLAKKGWSDKNFQVCALRIVGSFSRDMTSSRSLPSYMVFSTSWPSNVRLSGGRLLHFAFRT
jgi:hypothetical protein